jgi:hypothetical protein
MVTQDFIWQSLATTPQGVEVYRPGPYEGGYYFLAAPKYSAFHTCNTWAAETLRAAGFPIRAQGVLFAHQLWSQVRRAHQLQAHQLQGGLVPSWCSSAGLRSTGRIPDCLSRAVLQQRSPSRATVVAWLEGLQKSASAFQVGNIRRGAARSTRRH